MNGSWTRGRRTAIALAVATLATGGLAACGGGDDGSSAAGGSGGTYTWWDPYPQHAADSDWAQRVERCGEQAGVKIKRTAYDTTQLTNQALLAGQQGEAPDVILLDNPAVSTLAESGMLATTEQFGLDTSDVDPNLLAAGDLDDESYGIPIGANTLALYYNKAVLDAAGVDPAGITSWATLTDALEKIKAEGNQGITFSAIGTEEGSFQYLPWFWGSGAELTDLDSPEAVASLELWKGWLDDGLAPNSVINNSQNTVWEQFLTGDFGFAENGTWQVNSAADADFETGIIQIPAEAGGAAPAPTGGEFAVVPVQQDTQRYDTTTKIVECMTTAEGFVETANTFAYYIPPTEAGQKELLAEKPDLEVWVDAVREARGRTSDNLGTDYPKISEPLWTAVQQALSGSASPQEALQTAQKAADQATG
ncbi:MAG: extracellular solute-binding protein [Nocardioidaceae bacterium]|nr:extracellular solute-binding protein [Nocardioidaceae bacterium]